MATMIDQESQTTSLGQVIGRGFVAAHGAGRCPLSFPVACAWPNRERRATVAQGRQTASLRGAEHPLDPIQLSLSLLLSAASFAVAVAVLFLFPLLQGGILGQVRDRLESPHQAPGRFGSYGRTHYVRLLGSLGLYMLLMFALMAPVMCVGAGLAVQVFQLSAEAPDNRGDAAAAPLVPDSQQFTRQILTHPAMVVVMVIITLLASAVGMVYWVANCIIVSASDGVLASWRQSLRFCWQNLSAVLAVWLLIIAVSMVVTPVSLASQLGFVTDLWAVVGLALLQAVLIGYTGVLFAGLTMSLYIARRRDALQPESYAQKRRLDA